jgi:hypothetical protein
MMLLKPSSLPMARHAFAGAGRSCAGRSESALPRVFAELWARVDALVSSRPIQALQNRTPHHPILVAF